MQFLRRVHWMVYAGVIGLVVLGVILIGSGESPQFRAAAFMSALSRGDAKTLAELTYVEGADQAELLAAWEESVERAKYYRFGWQTKSMVQQSSDQAAVRLGVVRNPGPSSYEENYDLSLTKVDGEWKVVPSSLSRELYPYLPRF